MFRSQRFLRFFTIMIVIGLVIFLFNRYQNTSYNEEGFQLTPVKVNYYYMDGCGHCKDFTPVWDEFTQSYKGKVQFQKINMEDAKEDLKKYDIGGFPTVVIIDQSDKFEHYNGDRTVAGLQSHFG